MNDMLKKRPLTVNHTYDCLFKNRTRGLAEMDYDGSVVPDCRLYVGDWVTGNPYYKEHSYSKSGTQ